MLRWFGCFVKEHADDCKNIFVECANSEVHSDFRSNRGTADFYPHGKLPFDFEFKNATCTATAPTPTPAPSESSSGGWRDTAWHYASQAGAFGVWLYSMAAGTAERYTL